MMGIGRFMYSQAFQPEHSRTMVCYRNGQASLAGVLMLTQPFCMEGKQCHAATFHETWKNRQCHAASSSFSRCLTGFLALGLLGSASSYSFSLW